MFDAEIVVFIHSVFIASAIGQWMAIALARVWIFLFAPVLAWFWAYGSNKEKHTVKEAFWALGVSLLSSQLVALLVLRDRPFLALSEVITLIPAPLSTSFPSAHTASAVAITTALYYVNKRAGHIGLLITMGVILGRMSAGVHYPTDILGGIALGLLSFVLVRLGHKALRNTVKKNNHVI